MSLLLFDISEHTVVGSQLQNFKGLLEIVDHKNTGVIPINHHLLLDVAKTTELPREGDFRVFHIEGTVTHHPALRNQSLNDQPMIPGDNLSFKFHAGPFGIITAHDIEIRRPE